MGIDVDQILTDSEIACRFRLQRVIRYVDELRKQYRGNRRMERICEELDVRAKGPIAGRGQEKP